MNQLRYEFTEENKNLLLHFLMVAEEQKSNKYCNASEYKTFSKFFPLDDKLKNNLNDYVCKQTTIIDITQSDEESTENVLEQLQHSLSLDDTNLEISEQNINQSVIDDITYSIKENLETEKYLSSSVLKHLEDSKADLDKIFSLLSEELNFEEVLNFGISLKSIAIRNNLLISYYVRYLLIKKLALDYSDQLQEVLNEFSVRYSDVLLEELTRTLLCTENQSKVFLQFIDGLNIDFKTKIFRKFVFSCEILDESCIAVIDILISSQVEYDSLNRLVELMSNSTNNSDKSFGKLLLNVIKFLGKNCTLLEQPLKHIIGSHRSIWKAKLQKTFDDCIQDNSLFSQSFRKFVFSCEILDESCIAVIDILISSQVEYDSLNRLVELMSNSTNNSDKSFGKLLLNVIKFLGKNCTLLEQPLKHIIGSHRSIWKAKLQKTFDDCIQDNSLFSQSFRY